MKVIEDISQMKDQIKAWKKEGFSIGFVPTMGYLHEGHLSLVKAARANDRLVLSVFVNPMQFGVNEDLDKYPRDLDRDKALCKENGVDVLFIPKQEQIYPKDFKSFVDVLDLSDKLCGVRRKGHFKGVCTILMKFFNILEPTRAYFGQKDAQQCAIIKRMVEDLNMNLTIELCEIVREEDGLAKSSRNVYLNKEERQAALVLSKAIFAGKNLVLKGEKNANSIKETMLKELEKEKLAKLDYLELVDPDNLEKLDFIEGKVLGALAVFIGKTRLIDNFLLRN